MIIITKNKYKNVSNVVKKDTNHTIAPRKTQYEMIIRKVTKRVRNQVSNALNAIK